MGEHSILIDTMFWMQVLRDSERTVVVAPEDYERICQEVRDRGYEGFVNVTPSQIVTPGNMLIVDEQAIKASTRQLLQQRPSWGMGF